MKKEFILSIIISLTFLSFGFFMLQEGAIGYGFSFFVFLPFILGYILGGQFVRKFSLIGLSISLIIFFILLLIGGLEGMICVLMALPLVIVSISLGVIIKSFVDKTKQKKEKENLIKISVIPFLLFIIIGVIENKTFNNQKKTVEVHSDIILPYTSLEVYETIKSVDTLDAEKPFLMKLDLPIPQKCILEKEEIGASRTCYFEEGLIIEKVTALEKGKLLRMDVIDYQLTGRHWFEFKEAIYTFKDLDNRKCKMTRITTYTSNLYPRFYWEPLEKIGIEQEHEYVFNNLEKDLQDKYLANH